MINRDDRDGTNHLLEKLKPFPKKTETTFLLPFKPNSYVPTPKKAQAERRILNEQLLFGGISPDRETTRKMRDLNSVMKVEPTPKP